MKHKCPRCNYETGMKMNLLHHLARKNTCPPVNADIPIEDILNSFKTYEKSYICNQCMLKATFAIRDILISHQ